MARTLTYTRMVVREIPAETRLGRSPRRTWHILDDAGEAICRHIKGTRFTVEGAYGDLREPRICRHCHHEFSWSDTPPAEELAWQDNGYETPCQVWLRGKNHYGYGVRDRGGETRFTHRVAYEQAHGEIPAGYVVHHLCGVKECLNPDHLEAISRAEHIRLHRPELAQKGRAR